VHKKNIICTAYALYALKCTFHVIILTAVHRLYALSAYKNQLYVLTNSLINNALTCQVHAVHRKHETIDGGYLKNIFFGNLSYGGHSQNNFESKF